MVKHWLVSLMSVLLMGGVSLTALGCAQDGGWFEETGESIADGVDDVGESIEEAAEDAEDELD